MVPSEVLTFEKAILREVKGLEQTRPSFNNMPRRLQQALKTLDNDDSITIKPADKGGATVILNTEDYDIECRRQLENRRYYLPLDKDPTERLTRQIGTLINEAVTEGWITTQEAAFLVKEEPRMPYFYTLPKIHKGLSPPPGRPIVSGIDSLLEPLSQFCDHFLRPLVQATLAYLKDTRDVLNLIVAINEDNPEPIDLLVTLDVEALCTNIPQDATIETVGKMLHEQDLPYGTPADFIIELMTIALKHNFFKYNTTIYHQVQGTSMGSTFAPSLAGLYMASFEEEHIFKDGNPYHNNLITWKRYIDDILILWRGDRNECDSFLEWVNNLNTNLRFTRTLEEKSIPFLDLLIHLEGGQLRTTTFKKPTDRNSLLHFRSHHPKALRGNLPYGQFLRIRRNCSDTQDFDRQAHQLEKDLRDRQYPPSVVQKARKRPRNTNREALLEPKEREDTNTLTCVTTFTPASNNIKKIINRNWRIINSDGLNLEKPHFAFKRTANIRDGLVHTRPRSKEESNRPPIWNLPPVTGHHPCGNCTVCPMTTHTKSLNISGFLWEQRSHTNCNTKNCVYLITCPCNIHYVGMTTRAVKVRIGEHRSTIRRGKTATKLTNHFLSEGHNCDQMRWTILEAKKCWNSRTIFNREQHWVFRLNTHVQGLNEDIPLLEV